MLFFYRDIRPRAGCVCVRAVGAIRATRLGNPLLRVRVLVHKQAQCGSFLQVVVVVSSEDKKR